MSDIDTLLAAVFAETEAKAAEAKPAADAAKERAWLGRRGPRGNSKRAQVARGMLSGLGITDGEITVIYGKRRSILTAAKKLAEVYAGSLEVTGDRGSRTYRIVKNDDADAADDARDQVAVAEAA